MTGRTSGSIRLAPASGFARFEDGAHGGIFTADTGGSFTADTGGIFTADTGGIFTADTGGIFTADTGASSLPIPAASFTADTGGIFTADTGGAAGRSSTSTLRKPRHAAVRLR
jgi:hypothetical protein